MSNKIKDMLKILDKNFLFYSLEGEKIKEINDFFKVDNIILKINDNYQKIKEMSLKEIKLITSDNDYNEIINSNKTATIIYEDIGIKEEQDLKINKINFDKKEGINYLFTVEIETKTLKDFFKKIEDYLIQKEKLNLLVKAEIDEI